MASRRSASAASRLSLLSARAAHEALGLLLLGTALLAGLALWTASSADPIFRLGRVHNAAGPVGATLASLLRRGLGSTGWLAPVALALAGLRLCFAGTAARLPRRFWSGALLLGAALPPLASALHAVAPSRFASLGGGAYGDALVSVEAALFGAWGALLLDGFLTGTGGLWLSGISADRLGRAIAAGAAATGRAGARGTARIADALGVVWQRTRTVVAQASRIAGHAAAAVVVWRERRARRSRVAAARETEIAVRDELETVEAGEPAPVAAEPEAGERAPRPPRRRGAEPAIVEHRPERPAAPRQETFAFGSSGPHGPFQRPDLSLFDPPPEGPRSYDRDSLIMNSRILEKKLGDFGVAGRVVTVHPGPVVTMYEYEPASGVKLNRIVSLADDLALALRALSVRIIAPLPGKSVVGIEVANPSREVVMIRELLQSEHFRDRASKLTIALGKDIFGNPVDADLARMPHLLVAGATGTGKSVFLNALLCSILFRTTPDELKLLLVDPKLLELSMYEGIPHLIADVVTNPKRAAAALAGVVHKMEERYRWMQALSVRSIDQFNAKVDELRAKGQETFPLRPRPGEEKAEEAPLQRLPYILVVIDELADLMVVSARDVEEALQRLAQMARAAGIHLILATQRPSVDVLTGVIKANFPARISFQVSSRTDSRTILDQNGAEHLLGQGDMLFLPPGTSKLQRIHGAYVSEKEVARLVAFLREQGRPEFDETLTRLEQESEAKETRGEDVDDMYDQAIRIVAETRNASISYLQRRLKVGYNRAARMIEQMEIDGVVGPQDGTKPREVHVRPIELD
jgi:S-DNA-T family DNA segregation ATPase FtsK/SpoIIIE